MGVKQGCNLSPLIFNIFINDIHNIFDEACKPTMLNNWKINSLSFADDLVILSESQVGLERSLKNLEEYCNEWGLKVNSSKTKVMVFNRAFTKNIQNLTYTLDGEAINTTKTYCYLGIEMSSTGSFHKATDALYKKSLRALFSLYSAISIHSDETNTKLYLKLFDALIKPILLYGCEIWGSLISQPNNPISKFVNKFYRTLLGVPRYTSTTGVHVELGRFSIDVNVHSAMLKYWYRLITLPETRLVSHCYWSLLNNPMVTDPWLNSVKNIILSTGQYFVWQNQKQLCSLGPIGIKRNLCFMKQNLKDQFIQQSITKMANESKLHLFRNAKETLHVSNYLSKIKCRETRSLFSKLRLGVLPLEVEKGRRSKVDRNQRLCKICCNNQVEDETHFLFECAALANQRLPFYNNLLLTSPQVANFTNNQKLMHLYFNENISTSALDISGRLLVDLYKSRNNLLLERD